jgi:hypothetical protein
MRDKMNICRTKKSKKKALVSSLKGKRVCLSSQSN